MKKKFPLACLLCFLTSFSQENSTQRIAYKEAANELVQATYYYADNSQVVERKGFFNRDGELHGTWISYDTEGNKTVIAHYKNGKKHGTWTYFNKDNTRTKVHYNDNKIVSVNESGKRVN